MLTPSHTPAPCAPASRSGRELSIGDCIAQKYRVERLVGEGGMGRVYSARHLDLGRSFAIKVLRGSRAFDPACRRRFVAEARAASALWSRYVTRVFDSGTLDDGTLFMVLDLLEGCDLATVLERTGTLSSGAVAAIGLQVLDALLEAHAAGIVHRDIKPANVFLLRGDVRYPEVRVLDFGIARDLRRSSSSGSLVGTACYVAPEQLERTHVDGRADLWALGVMLYECLLGDVPFRGGSIAEVFGAIMVRQPPPLPESVPAPLAAALRRALAKDPVARFPTAEAMALALLPFVPRHLGLVPEGWVPRFAPAGPSAAGPHARPSPRSRPPPSGIRVARSPAELRLLPIDQRMAYVLSLVDGTTTRADVVDASVLSADETEQLLAELFALGALSE